ncbi:MAG: ribosome maturation factor RimP [Rhodospirillales bacterium]|nr:ribosome maturation factor RimP [Rhodospirillales bacterium]
MASDAFAKQIATLVSPAIEAMGYGLVRVQVMGRSRVRVQIMVERQDGDGMTVDDCADLSRAVSALLDVSDPISVPYTLEVSSPGIDRPLVSLADYDRFAGFEARIELGRLIDGRRRFQGRLVGSDGEDVRINVDGSEVCLPFADIRRAKLLLTDELIAAHG